MVLAPPHVPREIELVVESVTAAVALAGITYIPTRGRSLARGRLLSQAQFGHSLAVGHSIDQSPPS